MAKKRYCGCSLGLIVILSVVLLALIVVSFISGTVGSALRGVDPWSIFAVGTPHHSLPAEHIFGEHIPITNTMLTAGISILVLFGLFFAGTRKMKLVPRGLQNFVEFVYETLTNFADDVAGKEFAPKFYAVCGTIFLFVIANAWISLIPGFETIKLHGEPLLRNANTDINVPFMLAMVSFFFVEYWSFKVKRISYLKKYFHFVPLAQGFKKLFTGRVKAGLGGIGMGLIAVFAGLVELLSEFLRLVAFTFRLFGNMTAGLLVTVIMIYLVPLVLPSLFYGLEAFLGFVQAMIFGGLTLAFLTVGVAPEEEEAA